MLKLFLRITDRTSKLAESCAVLLLFGFCALMLAEVFARGFLAKSLPYSWEYAAFAMGAVFLLATGRAIRTGTHVRVSLALELTPAPLARFIDILANIAAIVVTALLVMALFKNLSLSIDRGLTSPTVVQTPLAIPQFVLLLGGLQFCLDLIARLIRLLQGEVTELRDLDAVPAEDPQPTTVGTKGSGHV